jgi:hypothetical protein
METMLMQLIQRTTGSAFQHFVALATAIVLMAGSSRASTVVHYDLDFEAPHVLNTLPVTGDGIDTPSSIRFGTPTVRSEFGALDSRMLEFNTEGTGTYEQIAFDLGLGYDN